MESAAFRLHSSVSIFGLHPVDSVAFLIQCLDSAFGHRWCIQRKASSENNWNKRLLAFFPAFQKGWECSSFCFYFAFPSLREALAQCSVSQKHVAISLGSDWVFTEYYEYIIIHMVRGNIATFGLSSSCLRSSQIHEVCLSLTNERQNSSTRCARVGLRIAGLLPH